MFPDKFTEEFLELKELLIREKVVKREQFIGCSEFEINDLERFVGAKLPASYKAFLRVMGKEGGSFTKTVQFVWEHMRKYRNWAEGVIQENNSSYQIPDKAFIFTCLDGYFRFFMLNEGDDPPIYVFGDGYQDSVLESQNIGEILWRMAQYMIDFHERMKKYREDKLKKAKE